MAKLEKQRGESGSFEEIQANVLFSSIGDGAILIDRTGHIQKVNDRTLELLGFKRDEVIGQWFPGIIVARDSKGRRIEPLKRAITRAFLNGKPISHNTNYVRKDGTTLPVAVNVAPLMFEGEPVGAIEVFRDITLEVEIDRMKSEFIALASHQLRTPLAAIKTYAHMLSGGYVGEPTKKQKEFINIILASTDRMNELIDTLLDITRIEAGEVTPELKRVDLNVLLQELFVEFAPIAKRHNISITEHTVPMTITTDPLLLKEVFANLISNALKYTPEGGEVNIFLQKDKKECVFKVSDNGVGIPAESQSLIFTKFFRASNIASAGAGGTGLGLYMAREITKILGGKIWFTSKENEGSVFYVSLAIEQKQ